MPPPSGAAQRARVLPLAPRRAALSRRGVLHLRRATLKLDLGLRLRPPRTQGPGRWAPGRKPARVVRRVGGCAVPRASRRPAPPGNRAVTCTSLSLPLNPVPAPPRAPRRKGGKGSATG